ncbi:nucleotide-sugar transporter-domain-containing protein [Lipomyces doorenjongii]|uniref:nucleotide-sugar transporter-domain-containing protein n=1 Tax=Lipomyces doorenjongii TaxID=383834 RepID=UPI0034CF5158
MSSQQDVPRLFHIPLKYISLVTLTFQNSALILIMHYSRVMPGYDSSSRYFASTAVLLNEIIKLCVCSAVAAYDRGLRLAWIEVFSRDCWKLAIPACLYTVQNSLQYVAVSNLDAATFQVTYQLKIITTAIFSVTMLHRSLSPLKWMSLLMLTLGIALVQLPHDVISIVASSFNLTLRLTGGSDDESETGKEEHHSLEGEDAMNRTLGLVAVLIACILSGLAGVYFEKVLKGTNASLWVRNVQLSFFSIFPALFIGVLWKDGASIAEKGFFFGYNPVVWTAIGFQAGGGIVVALCVNFADNIAKNFATSISILISFIASVYFFDFVVTANFVLGAILVLIATYLYSKPDRRSSTVRTQNKGEYRPVPLQGTTSEDISPRSPRPALGAFNEKRQ